MARRDAAHAAGEGINLVQFVIERRKHKLLDELMREAIFAPLGMTRTGMIYRKEFEDNVADRFDEKEKFRAQTKRFPARASGNMTSSADDLARFVSALFAGKILRNSTREAMLRPFIQIRSVHQFGPGADEGQEAASVASPTAQVGACSRGPNSALRFSRRGMETARKTT